MKALVLTFILLLSWHSQSHSACTDALYAYNNYENLEGDKLVPKTVVFPFSHWSNQASVTGLLLKKSPKINMSSKVKIQFKLPKTKKSVVKEYALEKYDEKFYKVKGFDIDKTVESLKKFPTEIIVSSQKKGDRRPACTFKVHVFQPH